MTDLNATPPTQADKSTMPHFGNPAMAMWDGNTMAISAQTARSPGLPQIFTPSLVMTQPHLAADEYVRHAKFPFTLG
jgi:hypothetical protein